MLKILFMASNPIDTQPLKLTEEIRGIRRRIQAAEYRDFAIEQEWAVRTGELFSILQSQKPDIVHFSGHGNNAGAIVMEDSNGEPSEVNAEILAEIFQVLGGNVRCVVLNACYSAVQAAGLGKAVGFVIGMDKAVADDAAIQFAGTFYEALAYGQTVQDAFELGRTAMRIVDERQSSVPKLLDRDNDAKHTRLTSRPELACELRRKKDGRPVKSKDDPDAFEARAFIRNAPADTYLVTYQLDPDYHSDPLCEVRPDEKAFELYFDCPHDFELRATLWCLKRDGIGLRTLVCDALEQRHHVEHPKVSETIQAIRDNSI